MDERQADIPGGSPGAVPHLTLMMIWMLPTFLLFLVCLKWLSRRPRVSSGPHHLGIAALAARLCLLDYVIACLWACALSVGVVFLFSKGEDRNESQGATDCFQLTSEDVTHLWRNNLYSATLPFILRHFVLIYTGRGSQDDGCRYEDRKSQWEYVVCAVASLLITACCVLMLAHAANLEAPLLVTVCVKPGDLDFLLKVTSVLTFITYVLFFAGLRDVSWPGDSAANTAKTTSISAAHHLQHCTGSKRQRCKDEMSNCHLRREWVGLPTDMEIRAKHDEFYRKFWDYLRRAVVVSCPQMALFVLLIVMSVQQHMTLLVTIPLYCVTNQIASAIFALSS